MWAFYGVRCRFCAVYSTLVPTLLACSCHKLLMLVSLCKIEFPLASCNLPWVSTCIAIVDDFEANRARHLATVFSLGAYCSTSACALRSPLVSQGVFESYTRYTHSYF